MNTPKLMEQKRRIIPPVYLLLSLIAMALLHFYLPVRRFLAPPNSYVGVVWILAGIGISAIAARSFTKAGTPVVPFERSTALVTTGLFKYTRNPMYLGMVFILIGAWLCFGSISPVVPIVAFVWIITANFIRGEERFLEDIFGEQYLLYKKQVRRWI